MWLSLMNGRSVTPPPSPCGSWRFGTLGLLCVHHANVVLDPTWCASENCFLLTGPLFGSPIVKALLKAEENRDCPSMLAALLARTHTISICGTQTHIAVVVLRSADSLARECRVLSWLETKAALYVILPSTHKPENVSTYLYFTQSHSMPAPADHTWTAAVTCSVLELTEQVT